MTTNSYFEYFLTLLAWIINNNTWEMLVDSGLMVLPLSFRILGEWLRVRQEGEDEGNKGLLLIPRLELIIYGAVMVIMACCIPVSSLTVTTLQFDTTRAEQCGYWTPVKPKNSGYQSIISSLDGQTAYAPMWWVLVHKLSKGVTQGAVAGIPCRPDLRQVRFDVQHTRINNPALAAEIQDFVRDCYSQSLATWKHKNRGETVDDSTLRDIRWIGSKTFLTTPGYYNELQSRKPHPSWSWLESRDSGFFKSGEGGYPYCTEWWSDSTNGLKARILANVSTSTMTKYVSAMKALSVSSDDYTEALVRQLISPRNMTVSQSGRVYSGYGGDTVITSTNMATRAASLAGTSVASLGAFPAFDAMRQALPMVQAIILAAIYIMIPMLLTLSGFHYKTAITMTFVIFGLNFMTFWWELARWLDSWMLTALYDSDTHSHFNIVGLQNTGDDIILNLVMGTMFIVLPGVWLAAFSWVGIDVGAAVNRAMASGGGAAQNAGGKAGDAASKATPTKSK